MKKMLIVVLALVLLGSCSVKSGYRYATENSDRAEFTLIKYVYLVKRGDQWSLERWNGYTNEHSWTMLLDMKD